MYIIVNCVGLMWTGTRWSRTYGKRYASRAYAEKRAAAINMQATLDTGARAVFDTGTPPARIILAGFNWAELRGSKSSLLAFMLANRDRTGIRELAPIVEMIEDIQAQAARSIGLVTVYGPAGHGLDPKAKRIFLKSLS